MAQDSYFVSNFRMIVPKNKAMNKIVVLICLFVMALATGCSDAQVKEAIGDNTLPASTGDIDEVVLLMNDKLLKGEPGENLRFHLQQDFVMLPQSEPMFDLRPLGAMKAFSNMLQRSAVVLIVADLSDGDSDITQEVKEQLERFKNEGKDIPPFFARRDVWSTPQRVVYLYGNNVADLNTIITTNANGVIKQLYDIGDQKAYNNAYSTKVNEGLTATLERKYKASVQVPNKFEVAKETDDFVWLRFDNQATEEVQNILLYIEPYGNNPPQKITEALAMSIRDKMGKNVSTQIAGSYMAADTTLGFVSKKTLLPSGLEVLEVRGLWRMYGDFMGGPFMTYCINDSVNKRLIVADAFVYAPKVDKRRIMRRVEMILRTTKLGGN